MATDEKFVSKFSDRRELDEADGFRSPKSGIVSGEEKRRGVRLNSQVPVILQWESGGVKREVQGRTRVVNPYGCLLLLPEKLVLDGDLQLTNLVTGQKITAAIVWSGDRRAEGWEHGVRLIAPQMDFWGLDL